MCRGLAAQRVIVDTKDDHDLGQALPALAGDVVGEHGGCTVQVCLL